MSAQMTRLNIENFITKFCIFLCASCFLKFFWSEKFQPMKELVNVTERDFVWRKKRIDNSSFRYHKIKRDKEDFWNRKMNLRERERYFVHVYVWEAEFLKKSPFWRLPQAVLEDLLFRER
jgi:hypothetical protein